jgi:hypothetical protein
MRSEEPFLDQYGKESCLWYIATRFKRVKQKLVRSKLPCLPPKLLCGTSYQLQLVARSFGISVKFVCLSSSQCKVLIWAAHADVLMRLEDALGGPLDEPAVVHQVRHVAPEKYHVCITFRVPKAIALSSDSAERENKRQKVDA